jgi:hypothetical protein
VRQNHTSWNLFSSVHFLRWHAIWSRALRQLNSIATSSTNAKIPSVTIAHHLLAAACPSGVFISRFGVLVSGSSGRVLEP